MGRKIRRLRRPTASLRHPRTTKGSSIAAPFFSYKKRVRRAATAPNSPRTPGWVDFPDSPKAVASSAAGIISELLHKVPTCPSRSPRAHRLRVRGDACNSTQPGPSGPPIGKFCRLEVPCVRPPCLPLEHPPYVNKEGSEKGILIIGSHAAILRK